MTFDSLIIGAGIFGLTTAIELKDRGQQTAVIDPGPIPHPLAASTDISKVVRMEYGTDEQYMDMVETAVEGWHNWNHEFKTTLYHETGVTMFTKQPMAPGGYEYESYQMLLKRGHTPERLDAYGINRRFPMWKAWSYVDGFFHSTGGYAESGRVVSALVERARKKGIALLEGESVQEIVQTAGRATAVRTQTGNTYSAATFIVAAGAWTSQLVPDLAPMMKSTGHPVFHLKPASPHLFTPPNFVVFTGDIARTGWYGFPFHPSAGVVKIANHGIGQMLHPSNDERIVSETDEENLRSFLAETFPALVQAPITYTRRCLYCDTLDEHFWIDYHPEVEGLFVAAGGSGHGFKFAPVLGSLVADAVERKANRWLPKFAWRNLTLDVAGEEAARHHG